MKKYLAIGAMALTMLIAVPGQDAFAKEDQGVKVLIDQELVGLAPSRQAAQRVLKRLLDFPALNAKVEREEQAFSNEVELRDFSADGQKVLTEEELYNRLKNLDQDLQVKGQGTWQDLAQKYGLDLEDLLEKNKAKESDPLPEKVLIPSEGIALRALAKEDVIYREVVDYNTQEIEDETLPKGQIKVVQKGVKGQQEVKAKVERINGEKVQHIIESVKLIKEPVDEIVHIGSKKGATGSFIKPTSGRLSSPFGPRWGRLHRGIDLACPVGTSVVAADGGVITRARTNAGSYGNYVDVDHGNGYTTRYAHLSTIGVKLGQVVEQGQEIAKSGNTGRSTGPHLHFEVCNKGTLEDPLKHIQL